jgi:serine/threonine protein kinase
MTTTQIGAQLHQQRYRIRQQLGRGGFGAVYLADDTRLPGRQVALKENLARQREAQAQFKREALLLARLRHPNLPQVTDYFFDAAASNTW